MKDNTNSPAPPRFLEAPSDKPRVIRKRRSPLAALANELAKDVFERLDASKAAGLAPRFSPSRGRPDIAARRLAFIAATAAPAKRVRLSGAEYRKRRAEKARKAAEFAEFMAERRARSR